MVILIVIWIVLSFLIACFGAFRNIGFTKTLLSAIFLTPLIGIIIAAMSKSKKDIAKQKETDRLSKEYLDLINRKK